MLLLYLLSLLLTVVLEAAVAYLLGFHQRRFQIVLALINLSTNLMLNYLLVVLAFVGLEVSLVWVTIGELGVVLVEWGMLIYTFSEPKQRLLLTSILGNAASFGAGLILFWT